MEIKIKIILFFLFYTFSFVSGFPLDTIKTNTEQQKDSIIITIFNKENYYVKENTVSINNKYITIIDNKIIPSKNVVFYKNPQTKITIENNILVANKVLKSKGKFIPSKSTVSQNPSTTTNYLPFGSLPNDNFLFTCNLHNSVVAPSKPRFILYANSINLMVNNTVSKKTFSSKKVFLYSETLHISSFFSKTSRIRPPPFV